MARKKDIQWSLPENVLNWEQANAAILMDIRDELKAINRVLYCSNCLAIPHTLNRIARNTAKPRKRKAGRR